MELAEIETMIAQAEAELASTHRRLGQAGRIANPSDPFDPVGCLELWLAALYATRDELQHSSGRGLSTSDRLG